MVSSTTTVPQWVQQLQSPPAAKSKSAGIVDPIGFAGPSGSGKVRSPATKPMQATLSNHDGRANAIQQQKQKDSKDSKVQPRKAPTSEEMDTLKLKKAWEVALAPVKALPMTFIMMYMSGNSLQIFSIMMVFMAFKNPIMGLANTNQAFERFQTETNAGKILQTKLVYVVMQLVALGVGIWKVNGMGLLP